MKDIERLVNEEIVALIPVYVNDIGNSTSIITKDLKESLIEKSIRTILKILARYFSVDLNASRKYYGSLIGYSNIVPIPFNRDNIFIPIKTRKAITKNDGSFGYFNLKYIEGIETSRDKTYIRLHGNLKIESIQSRKSIERHIKDGNLVKKIYNERMNPVVMESNNFFYTEYNKPATKGDIAALRNELLDIKSKLV